MFNLEHSISEWRRQLTAAGIKEAKVLDELECHLREDVERQVHSTIEPEEAFRKAVQRIGPANALRTEFRNGCAWMQLRPSAVIGIACGAFAGLFSLLVTPRLITIPELSLGARLLGLAAVAVTALSILSWRFSYRFLPAIRHRGVRTTVGVACGLAGAAWILVFGNLLPNVIVPHLFGGASAAAAAESVRGSVLIGTKAAPSAELGSVFLMAISILWAMAFMAVLGSLAYGLEAAARRKDQTAVS